MLSLICALNKRLRKLCRELVCIIEKWTWYNGRDNFHIHITSGWINTWKGVNQLKENFFYIYIWNWQVIGILWLKTIIFTIHKKIGFCCNVLSLNDFTDQSDQSTGNNEPTRVQTGDDDTSLFPGESLIALRPCAGKAGVTKRCCWCLGIIPSNRCCQFSMISQILDEIHL